MAKVPASVEQLKDKYGNPDGSIDLEVVQNIPATELKRCFDSMRGAFLKSGNEELGKKYSKEVKQDRDRRSWLHKYM